MTEQPPRDPSPADATRTVDPIADHDGILDAFLAELVADDYPAIPAPAPVEGPVRRAVAIAVAAAIGLVICVALLNARFSVDERQQTRAVLVDRVASATDAVHQRQAALDELDADVDALQAGLLASAENGPQTAARVDALSGRAGVTELVGPGLAVDVDDAPGAEAGSMNRVLDRDVQDIVNALWRAGATGIAVNDQRLTDLSAIRAAGDAILVDYQPLTRPYTVSAVGATQAAAEASGLVGLLDSLAGDYGLVTSMREGDIALPAGDLRSPRFAQPDESEVSSP